jgi:hypothetical protein
MTDKSLTLTATGAATAPTAATGIAVINAGSLPAGNYRILAEVGYAAGTMGANEQTGRNFGLYVGGSFIDYIPAPAALETNPPVEFSMQLDGASAVSIGNPSAGSTGVVYVARLQIDSIPQTPGQPTSVGV